MMKVLALLFAVTSAAPQLVYEKVARKLDLTTNIYRLTIEATLRNDGDKADSFEIIQPGNPEHLADFEVLAGGKPLAIVKGKTSAGLNTFTVTVQPPLGKGETLKFAAHAAHTHMMEPYPAEIAQNEDQFFVVNAHKFLLSAYKAELSTFEITFPSAAVESYTPENAVLRGSTLTYGPFKNVEPFSDGTVRLHYKNNYPFATLTDVVREVEISHWGHLSFEEHISAYHSGPKLKGGFSRLDFQRGQNNGAPSSFRAFTAKLPASAYSLYYRDVIGNISTSRANVDRPSGVEPFTRLEMFARFVMFGGWKTQFYYGYVVPLSEFLGIAKDGSYHLEVPFGTAISGAVVDSLTTRFILPEGCTDVKVSGISEVTIEHSSRPTYLDVAGRHVVSLHKRNVVGDNQRPVTVSYRYSSSLLLFDVSLVVLGFFTVFFFFIASNRLRLSIGKEGLQAQQFKETAQELSGRLHAVDARFVAAAEAENEAAVKVVSASLEKLKVDVLKFDAGLSLKFTAYEAAVADVGKLKGEKKAAGVADAAAKFLDLDADLTSKL